MLSLKFYMGEYRGILSMNGLKRNGNCQQQKMLMTSNRKKKLYHQSLMMENSIHGMIYYFAARKRLDDFGVNRFSHHHKSAFYCSMTLKCWRVSNAVEPYNHHPLHIWCADAQYFDALLRPRRISCLDQSGCRDIQGPL